ncbi:MAG: histidine kinase [Bacteroidetes bacterium]|nr:histidine kinase [Bacteroidota bacterium]
MRILAIVLTLIGITRGLQHYYIVDAFEQVQFPLWWHVPFNLFLWWLWLLFVPVISWGHRRLILSNHTKLYWIFLTFLFPLCIVFLRQTIASFVISEILHGYKSFLELIHIRMLSNVWIWLDYGMYFTLFGSIIGYDLYAKGHETEQKLIELKTQLLQSQLKTLEGQLHPHFLFNTLNTLSTLLLKRDKIQAKHMLELLQNYLSTTLFTDNRSEIPLADEIKYINEYLQIEKVRFQDRLHIKQNITEEVKYALVPRFILQPIVENSLYHGIAPKKEGGTISITAKRENRWLTIHVEDDGVGANIPKTKKQHGVGLSLVRDRLVRLYENNYRFVCESPTNGGFIVTITIPYRILAL